MLPIPFTDRVETGHLLANSSREGLGRIQSCWRYRIRQLGISAAEVNRVIVRETLEMARREAVYREGRPARELRDKTAILVDDGVATGATMAAAARQVRSLEPRKVVVAAPVASSQAAGRIAPEADECVWLALPEPFLAAGQWYDDFREITEAEVRSLLADGYWYCSQ